MATKQLDAFFYLHLVCSNIRHACILFADAFPMCGQLSNGSSVRRLGLEQQARQEVVISPTDAENFQQTSDKQLRISNIGDHGCSKFHFCLKIF